MCGITGWVDWQRDLGQERPTLLAMTETMIRRGPDAGGVWVREHAFLGHRRLSIIDLAGGTQPMAAAGADDVVISYSGETYNFRELRAELRALGQVFRTSSDTEVVLNAYRQWGVEFVRRLNGMYAFAIWDGRTGELLLVRDRLGIKPLYYHPYPGGLLFGSEPKALLANPLFEAELDDEGVAELFAVPTAPTPGHGVYSGLRQVQPGHVVRFTRHGLTDTAYWTLPVAEHTDDLATTRQRVRDLLGDIVARQLVADVPVGSLLSGGVDSSAITALAVRERAGGEKIATYSVDFPGGERAFQRTTWHPSRDEPYVHQVSAHLGTQHTTILVQPEDVLGYEDRVLRARDLPGWGEMDVSLHLLFEKVRGHSTVALSGESADEVFGGYPYFADPAAHEFPGFPWMRGRTSPATLLREEIRQRVRPDEYMRDRHRQALAEVPELPGESTVDARLRQVSYLALTRWLGALLERKDRMSMATGLEVRVPFCDHRLVEYVWNVPWSIKAAGGQQKGLLRQAVADLLPEAVVNRGKSGFPPNPDPGYLTALRERAVALLHDRDARVFDLVDRERVGRLLAAGQPLPSPRAATTATAGLNFLLNIDAWLRAYRVRIR
ncbi:asparagine synthase (glutamine-hydrolyzing) [Goodfellowiella coeruleoviolacea]|uniref:asparagine synthase (glutamine-hydrolyzing) n=1 Tax=Goodfellowiella coeruleoviolacea TaxID=334858 RepID=A0AAE3GI35_9PSEU|nr:asparagine synthase (glutamine-hydrolyzing) [Goodfellowiella coeruleoviolacea]MCP2167799.1 asparagine synthase (glutamine-hydrolyzing) [Goodfellowiella coeruleoviolacea]